MDIPRVTITRYYAQKWAINVEYHNGEMSPPKLKREDTTRGDLSGLMIVKVIYEFNFIYGTISYNQTCSHNHIILIIITVKYKLRSSSLAIPSKCKWTAHYTKLVSTSKTPLLKKIQHKTQRHNRFLA